MSATTTARWRAAALALAPAVLLAGVVYHPYIANPTDSAAVAAALADDTTRWGLAHLAVAVGSGLAALAFLALRGFLREAGEERWSGVGVPFAVMGCVLFALLPAMELGALAAHEAGADGAAVQRELDSWFLPVLLAAGVTFALGVLCLAAGVARSGALARPMTRLVVAALVLMAVTRFVPLGASLYVGGVGSVVALWPLAYVIGRRPQPSGSTPARAMPAT